MKKRKKIRHIIYVDASVRDGVSKIGLYDMKNHATHILQLNDIPNNNVAEEYAVLHALLYIIKNGLENCHILSDNLQATNNKNISSFCRENSVSISWIPREINKVADSICKLSPTCKEKDWNILKLFYSLVINKKIL